MINTKAIPKLIANIKYKRDIIMNRQKKSLENRTLAGFSAWDIVEMNFFMFKFSRCKSSDIE